MKTRLLILGLLLLIASSCKKDEDPDPPVIVIDKPVKGQSLKVGESFQVSGNVKDASGIKSIQVKLLDADLNNPYVLANQQYENQKEVAFSFSCKVDDPLIESGKFWIRVRAHNNQSVYTQEFVEVHVNELEKKLEKLLVITQGNMEAIKVYEQSPDTSSDRKLVLNHSGDFLFSNLSSRYQEFFLGVESGEQELRSFGLAEFEELFAVTVPMPFPVFTFSLIEEPYLYYATGNGRIRGVDAFGLEKFSTPVNLDTFPQSFAFSSQHLLAACKTRAWDRDVLKLHYRESGAFIWRRTIEFDIVNVKAVNDGNFLVFGNDDGDCQIYLYNPMINSLDLLSQHEGELETIEAIDTDRYLLEIENNWYLYHVSSDTYTLLFSFISSHEIRYEPLSNDIYIFGSLEMSRLDLESMEIKSFYFYDSPIKDIQFWYNK